MLAPCKNCSDRSAECHTHCEKYLNYRREQNILRDQRNKSKDLENSVNDWMKRIRR